MYIGSETKKFLYWVVVVIMTLIALITFGYTYYDGKQREKESIGLERTPGVYKVTSIKPPPNMTVDLQDNTTGATFKNVFVSQMCPKYTEKAQLGMVVKADRVVNYRLTTMEKFTTFDKLYEPLCTNKRIEENKPAESKAP